MAYPVGWIVGAGPVGAAAAILLAQRGVPSLLLDRYPTPYPLPRAVHLDDEVMRILQALGVAAGFAAVSRPGLGLRLLDARHRVMAEFRRDPAAGRTAARRPTCSTSPTWSACCARRVGRRCPLIEFRGGVTVTGVTLHVGRHCTGTPREQETVAASGGPRLRRRQQHGPRPHRRHPGGPGLRPSAGWSSTCVTRPRPRRVGRRPSGLRPAPGGDLHAAVRGAVPVGVPAARRRDPTPRRPRPAARPRGCAGPGGAWSRPRAEYTFRARSPPLAPRPGVPARRRRPPDARRSSARASAPGCATPHNLAWKLATGSPALLASYQRERKPARERPDPARDRGGLGDDRAARTARRRCGGSCWARCGGCPG